jgi:opacity protein-like surface antigen
MKNNLFDNFVKENFNGYKPDVPSHIWENIAAKKDRKKPFTFWITNNGKAAASLFFIILAGCIGYYLNTNNIAHKSVSNTPVDNKINNVNENIPKAEKRSALNRNSNNENTNIIKETTTPNAIRPTAVITNSHATKNIPSTGKPTHINKIIEDVKEKDVILTNNNEVSEANIAANEKEIKFLPAMQTSAAVLKSQILSFNPKLRNPKIPVSIFIPCPEAEKNAAGNKQYIELYAGPDYVFKSYEDTGSNYITKRKESTTFKLALSTGVRYTRVFSNGISFRVGLNYSQINENFFAKNGYSFQNLFSVNAVGDTTSNYILRTAEYTKSTNTYKSIDIPLQMGYELGNSRFHVNLSAGAIINIVSKQTGNVVDNNDLAVDITSGKSSSTFRIKPNTGVSLLGSASFYYKLNERLHLMAEPYIRYGLSNVTQPDITFKQKYHTLGLRLGVRWDL